jgi:hypothetical protein
LPRGFSAFSSVQNGGESQYREQDDLPKQNEQSLGTDAQAQDKTESKTNNHPLFCVGSSGGVFNLFGK